MKENNSQLSCLISHFLLESLKQISTHYNKRPCQKFLFPGDLAKKLKNKCTFPKFQALVITFNKQCFGSFLVHSLYSLKGSVSRAQSQPSAFSSMSHLGLLCPQSQRLADGLITASPTLRGPVTKQPFLFEGDSGPETFQQRSISKIMHFYSVLYLKLEMKKHKSFSTHL